MKYINTNPRFQFRYKFLLIYTMFIISKISLSTCEIKRTQVFRDSRPMILFERFGFERHGRVSIDVKEVSWISSNRKAHLNSSSMGFFVARESSFPRILIENANTERYCVLSSKFVTPIFKFENSLKKTNYNGSITIDEADQYSLIFGNCQPEFQVTMYVETEMYNVKDGHKDFLPAGQTILPNIFLFFFLIYSVFFGIWVFICTKLQRSAVDKIHIIMGALLLVKALKMICAYEDKLYVRRTGTPHGWDIAFYAFGFIKGIMLFTVIILIGTGWSFLKPYLQERERNLLIILIPLQVLENIAYVVISETGPATKDFVAWSQMFLLIDIVCCSAVFFPIVWSIQSLREASKTDGKAVKNLEKLTLFKQFYVVVVGYLYFTRIVVSVLGGSLDYKYEWMVDAAGEGASLAFYVFIFYNFQPVEKNPYLVIHEADEVVAGQILDEDQSFEL